MLTDAPPPEPAFLEGFTGDYGWLNGANYQPASPLTTGPVTWLMLVDAYYGYAANQPADHTVFPTTSAPRHNEFNLNMGLLGLEVTQYKHLFGKLVFQAGNSVDTITGTDASTKRGAYGGLTNMRHVQQAYAGHHMPGLFPAWGGANLVAGLFPAYIGADSYLPQENWSYTHNLLSDFTPYYLQGVMLQAYPRPDLKAELWLVNGWQTLSKVNEGFGYGYQLNWRPGDRLSLAQNLLAGNFEADASRTRIYFDHTAQWKYAQDLPFAKHLAVGAVADVGYDTASAQPGGLPATWLGGAALMHRAELSDQWAFTLRGSAYADPQGLVALPLPGGQPLPAGLRPWEATATLDYRPSPWVLYRLEARHDQANVPYVAGPGGVTGATPDLRLSGDRATANVTLRF